MDEATRHKPPVETKPAIMSSEIAIEDPTLGDSWVEICHQFSALQPVAYMCYGSRGCEPVAARLLVRQLTNYATQVK